MVAFLVMELALSAQTRHCSCFG